MTESRQFHLAVRPEGEIKDSDFTLVTAAVPEPADDEFVVEITHVSIDPAMRGWMSAARSYIPPVEIGEVMRALAVGRVIASRHEQFRPGDWVHGAFGVQEHAVSDGQGAYKIEVNERLTPAAYLGVLGLTGLTAYFGLLKIGRLAEGETVLVSGAAGGVGTAVGQIAKLKGARAVGIAGGPEKCRMLVEELGFDGAIDYKRGDLLDQLREHTPDRVDVFFDNVGGEILNQGLTRIRRAARVVICGAVSQYNASDALSGPSNYMALLVFRASMAGFVVFDFADRYQEAIAEMAGWVLDGQLRSVEDTVAGDIETFPGMLRRLFAGQNTGKLALELSPMKGQT
jgi:NADPH-dependent curcumin reductase CurA